MQARDVFCVTEREEHLVAGVQPVPAGEGENTVGSRGDGEFGGRLAEGPDIALVGRIGDKARLIVLIEPRVLECRARIDIAVQLPGCVVAEIEEVKRDRCVGRDVEVHIPGVEITDLCRVCHGVDLPNR